MSSFITFRKEFEDIILKGKLNEALKTLVPNSNEKIYVQFCEEYKKCLEKKEISKNLNTIIENANKNHISNGLIKILETKRDLLEYDLPSTSKEKKEQIIDILFNNYCKMNLNYNAPFFAREKKSEKDDNEKQKNKTPLELTEKLIKIAIDKMLKQNERDQNFRIINTPENKRIPIFLEYIDKNMEQAYNVLDSRVQIPFHLMNKDEFSKVIKLFNGLKKKLNDNYYNCFTIEQIERLLKEVKNEMYIYNDKLISILMDKKYNVLIKKALKENSLDEVKKILWEVYDIYKNYSPKFMSGTLLYILKINKMKNLLELKPLIEYIKNPIQDNRLLYQQREYYIQEIKHDNSFMVRLNLKISNHISNKII